MNDQRSDPLRARAGAGADPLQSPSGGPLEPSSPVSERPVGRTILDSDGIGRATKRLAHEILERSAADGAGGVERLALVAIAQGGVPIGELIQAQIAELAQAQVPLGILDVTLYRDDVIGHGRRPIPHRTRMPLSVEGRRVILVEDVVYTGRTIRAAMDAVLDFGRPEAIHIATLVDRGHRELPIQVDFVGKNIPTARGERVELRSNLEGGYEVVVL